MNAGWTGPFPLFQGINQGAPLSMLDPLDLALAAAEIDDEPVGEAERRDTEISRE